LCIALARFFAAIYWRLAPRRREVVVQNLLPVLNGNRHAAEETARSLFREFAIKLADLWRYESGLPLNASREGWKGWDLFVQAQARGKGVLLITPHLGNWELGGAFLAQRGVKLLVLTQAEPEPQLTRLRQDSRARWGIETLVVGEDAFGFVEIIKRLQAGATVALLVDRPPPATAVTVEAFGRPIQASVAAAELARASGCAIVPAYLVRHADSYLAQILPEIPYDRAAIGDRAARTRLTQEIMRAFEPIIRQHVEQWYHFVPVWPENLGIVPRQAAAQSTTVSQD
jgi:KDO2-lipid IV(A) lauroyltransferase